MSRTVTALYDTRQEAEAARQRLASAVDVDSDPVAFSPGMGVTMPRNDIFPIFGIPRSGSVYVRAPPRSGRSCV